MNSPYKFTDPLGLAARPRQSSLVDAGAIASDARNAPAAGTDPIVTGGRASAPASAQQTEPPGPTRIDPGPVDATPNRRDASSDPTGPPVRPRFTPTNSDPNVYKAVVNGKPSFQDFAGGVPSGPNYMGGRGAIVSLSIENTKTGNTVNFNQQVVNDGTGTANQFENGFVPSQNGNLIQPVCLQDCNLRSDPNQITELETADPAGADSINRQFGPLPITTVNRVDTPDYDGILTVTTTTTFTKTKGNIGVNVTVTSVIKDYIPKLPK
jgi:hypothetical protein